MDNGFRPSVAGTLKIQQDPRRVDDVPELFHNAPGIVTAVGNGVIQNDHGIFRQCLREVGKP